MTESIDGGPAAAGNAVADGAAPGMADAAAPEEGAADGAAPGGMRSARVLGLPHAGADGRHRDEPSPFHDGDLVGVVGPIRATPRPRPDAEQEGPCASGATAAGGPVEVSRDGLVGGPHGGAARGGADRALYVMDAAEQEHWSRVLGGIEPGRLGENLLIVPGPAGGIDDVELGAILAIGDPAAGGVRVRVTGVRNPCPDFARSAGRDDWVEVFSARNRVGVYLRVLASGRVRAGDEVRVVSSPGHRVTCTRWFAHHDPRDAQAMLNSEIFGNCVIAPFTRDYVRAAAHERIG